MIKIIITTLSGFLLLALQGCSQMTVKEHMQVLNAKPADEQYLFEELPNGMQDDPELDEHVIELPSGRSFYKGYRLSPGHGSMTLQLRTYITGTEIGEGFFYPVVELFDFSGKSLEVMRPQLRFTQLSSKGRYAAVPIEIARNVSRLVIRTEPKLYGEDASYTTQHQGSSWSYSVTPFSKRKAANYLPLGKLELLTPDEGFSFPFEKLAGPYWQLSYSRGEETLASGEDYLPNLTTGGGPELTFGYSWAIPGQISSSLRTGLGLGFYSLTDSSNLSHSQSYLTADVMWVESNHVSSLAIGLTAKALHEYKGGGNDLEFDPAFGPKVAVELRGSMGVSLGAFMSWVDFTDQYGRRHEGDQVGFYLMRLY